MSAGAFQGYIIGLFAFGTLMIGLGAGWSYLTGTVNTLIAMGMMDQNGANTFGMLSILFYLVGFMFLLIGGINVIMESKRQSSRGV